MMRRPTRKRPRRGPVLTRRRALRFGAAGLMIAALGVGAWKAWAWAKLPPASTAEEVYTAVTTTDPATLTDETRKEWAAHVGSALDHLPPAEFDKLLKKTADDATWREHFRAVDPEQRRKLRDMMSEDQRMAMMTQRLEQLKQMTPEERQEAFERFRGPGGFGPPGQGGGGPGGRGGFGPPDREGSGAGPERGSEGPPAEARQGDGAAGSSGQPGGRPAPTAARVAERLASKTPTQRAQFRQVFREMRKLREEAGISR
jgi:hypothetical protein